MSTPDGIASFAELDLPATLQKALAEVGYETPTAIQARIIPHMLEGADVLGQAQTGTGKTAAFALPILARLDLRQKLPQVLVLAPTRELAIQVAEAFQKYARHLPGFHVLPIYGGSDMRGQLRQLERGVHVVVGTPGRVMDHMRRGSLNLSRLQTLVLDEADEMLRMGFIDDVEWILEQTPDQRQIALFSATMPDAIRRIAKRHLTDPREISIEVKSVISAAIRQRVWMMAGVHKLDALTRILEVEDFDGMIIFVRTRILTTELADKLAARGYSATALNGDIPQKQREQTIERLKSGELDILVATDVAARGLDVGRISHVINYDIPYDVEAYVHRIGRTGRAGKTGETILFAANRERRLLRAIEKATGETIAPMTLPTAEQVTDKRIGKFKQRITETLDTAELKAFRKMVEDYQHEYGVPVIEIAAALGALAQGSKPLVAKADAAGSHKTRERPAAAAGTDQRRTPPRKPDREPLPGRDIAPGKKADRVLPGTTDGKAPHKPSPEATPELGQPPPSRPDLGAPLRAGRSRQREAATDTGMEHYRIEVGLQHGVKPGNIVGAIANEAEIESEYIGRIEIFDDYSTVQLPEGMPREIFKHLKNVWVSGQRLQISRLDQRGPVSSPKPVRAKPRTAAPGGGKAAGKKGPPHRKPK
ncbi:MAG: DEAD/DEAH box helicase [Pseudomonadales bacterium]|nr:DEAD/DEAH box helicase [Halioglobus sp.]MCP5121376.1 DEAD/DEAH box helicase [Pseudomonadales bacterium]MCP5193284.1 DEAD/DEAH box helicase [Pseudomonadales bacterium]